MTKLEQRIAEVADTLGKTVVIGRQGHKVEWFANCDGEESYGSSAAEALESLIVALIQRDAATVANLTAARTKLERLEALTPKWDR